MGEVSQICRASLSRLHLGQESRLVGHGSGAAYAPGHSSFVFPQSFAGRGSSWLATATQQSTNNSSLTKDLFSRMLLSENQKVN